MSSMRSLFILALLSAPGAVIAENEATQVSPQLRQRAEDLAGAASNRFSDLLDGGQRVTQAPPQTSEAENSSGAFAPVWDWLARSAQAYDDLVITQLKEKDGWTVIVQRNDKVSPPGAQAPTPAEVEVPQRELRGWTGLVEVVRDWLARANRSYRTEIVKPLLEPAPGAEPPSEIATQPPAPMASPSAPPATADKNDAAAERIKQEAQAADTNRAIDETEAKGKAEDEKRLAEQAEAKRAAEAEAKRVADEVEQKRKAEEDKRLADEADERRKADEEKRVADVAEAKRKAEEDQRLAAKADAQRRADEEKRVADEAEAKRKADDAKREAEVADAAERKAVSQAEAEAKRQAEIDAEATRRSEAAARAKETARAEATPAPSASRPTAETSPDVTERATASPTPTAKAPMAAGASTSPGKAASENSAVAEAPSAPEQKPKEPEPVREATPKAREEAVRAEVEPTVVAKKKPGKRTAANWRSGKKSGYRHKRAYALKKQRRPRFAYGHVRMHRAYAPDVVQVGRRCDCRCGRVFQKPRMQRAYRVRPLKHRRGGLTYRYGRHYIR